MARRKLRKSLVISILVHVVVIAALIIYFVDRERGGKAGSSGNGGITGVSVQEGNTGQIYSQTDVILVTANEQPKSATYKTDAVPLKEKKGNVSKKQTISKTEKAVKKEAQQIPQQKSTNRQPTKNSGESSKPHANSEYQGVSDTEASGIESKGVGGIGASEVALIQPGSGTNEIARPDYNINPKPKYPNMAKRRGYEGKVLLRVFVLKSGAVGDIEVTRPSGHSVLDESALKAVWDWVFIPGRENGTEISSWVTVPIQFQLDNG